ncbi:MAG: hypothetical protein EB127_03905 [Alphaproteobacteria bacterium]|nr:hypothetical protein [Alphaproteobacteria bacterium]
METKSNYRQVTVFDATTKGHYTVMMPQAEGPITVSGANGVAVAKQLGSLFPEYEFIYEKDRSYIYDAKVDRLVRDKEASDLALVSNGVALLETACYAVRRELTIAADENRTPDYVDLIGKILSAFNEADRYFVIAETKEAKARVKKTYSPFSDLRPPVWSKGSSDYDGDDSKATDKITDKNIWGNQKLKGVTSYKLPFGVGYAFDGDINDIEKLTKELEVLFKGVRR